MAILLIRNDQNYDAWLTTFSNHCGIQVYTPRDSFDPKSIKMILCWKAPLGSFSSYPNIQVIGSMGAGVDHIFKDSSLPDNVLITRIVDDKLSGDMQEFVLTLCLNYIKNLKTYFKFQQKNNWNPLPYLRIEDVQVGIMGLGILGTAVGKMLSKVGFQVSGWSKSRKNIDGIKSFIDDELQEFLAPCDILVCLLPLTPETKSLLNKDLFKYCKKGCYLINVARGSHLNEEDLIHALDQEILSGAAIDVFEKEPLPDEHPFWNRSEILITPHIASVSNPESVIDQVIRNYRAMKNGEALHNVINRDLQY